MNHHRQHWGLGQWTAFLREKEMPIMPRSKAMIDTLEEQEVTEGEVSSPREVARIVIQDPFLALRLLRGAERQRSQRLGHETTTILSAVLHLGVEGIQEATTEAILCDDSLAGLRDCDERAVLSARIARDWATHRIDVSPEEVALAALLGEMGELMLWAFAPELPQRCLTELHSGRATRNAEAQQNVAGFTFKQLSIALIEAWALPPLMMQLVRGADTTRANIARIASDTARHILANPRNPAIPSDVLAIHGFLPNVTWETLLSALPIDDDYREAVYAVVALSGDDLPSDA